MGVSGAPPQAALLVGWRPPGEPPFKETAVHDTYTTVAGDTLESLAERYDKPVELLAAANGLLDDQDVQPGQIIVIPT